MKTMIWLSASLLIACGDKAIEVDETDYGIQPVDQDLDGFFSDVDCDDFDPLVNPDAVEACDGIDNNCSGEVDEDVRFRLYPDQDGDGFGDPERPTELCDVLPGYVPFGNDCDDNNPEIFSGATEVCNDIDDDCDGDIDEGLSPTLYYDADGDGYGDSELISTDCSGGEGYVYYGGDCDDSNPDVYPFQREVCDDIDNDCNGLVDDDVGNLYYRDADGDGYGDEELTVVECAAPEGYVERAEDCDDSNPSIYPFAEEYCNGVDEDCDGEVDEEAVDAPIWYYDIDGDGIGAEVITAYTCTIPEGYVETNTDCDDSNPTVYPGAPEYCTGLDNDCNGVIDDNALNPSYWHADLDGDGYGDLSNVRAQCDQPVNYVRNSFDCDDTDSQVYPNAPERCNGIDDDCDLQIDDGIGNLYYRDVDGDGYGDEELTVVECAAPEGYVERAEDCDDSDPSIHPLADEYCNDIDEDCDGEVDEESVDATIWYYDIDGDGAGAAFITAYTCTIPEGYVATNTDCDDTNATVYPGATEYCTGLDNDCNGLIDDSAQNSSSWYADSDGDGYGDLSQVLSQCDQPVNYVRNSFDCDDTDPQVYPNAPERCNGIDDDCDLQIDDGVGNLYYRDVDGDGYGDEELTVVECAAPEGYVERAEDCDDGDPSIHPLAEEYCDGVDEDCDGDIDEESVDAPIWYYDIDGDGVGSAFITAYACTVPAGYVDTSTDCDDTNPSVYPSAPEYCTGLDNDCNGSIDDNALNASYWYADSDGDGYGDLSNERYQCDQPVNYVRNSFDCNDTDSEIYPSAPERCNGIDDDCDLQIDDGTVDSTSYYLDADLDGFGDPDQVITACSQPDGYILDGTDCDDDNPTIYPGAQEFCDGVDQSCDGSNFYEQDLDGNGWLACQESVWFRNSTSNPTDPQGACSQAGGYLQDLGVQINQYYHGNTTITASLLEDFGLYVHHGTNFSGAIRAYTNAEAYALAEWVYNGGRFLYIGYNSNTNCDIADSIPSQFGFSCSPNNASWSGSTGDFVSHPLTVDLSNVGGAGGENWSMTAPAEALIIIDGQEFVAATEYGQGKVVLVANELPFYNTGTTYPISYGDNALLVQNIWSWLLE